MVSGESLPFLLSVISPTSPTVAKLIASNIQVKLIKRTYFAAKTGQEITSDDVQLALADVEEVPHSQEGVSIFKGSVTIGKSGQECSWRIRGVAEVQVRSQVGSGQRSRREMVPVHFFCALTSSGWCHGTFAKFPTYRSDRRRYGLLSIVGKGLADVWSTQFYASTGTTQMIRARN
jgi:hypothetical protein